MKTNFIVKSFFTLALLFLLNACGTSNCKNSYSKDYKGSVKVGNSYQVNGQTYTPLVNPTYDEVGMASWYGHHFHCKKTANGESFNKHQYSAAHKTLPLPSVARVTNLNNGKSVEVIINDRGPFIKGRIIDLSEGAAGAIGMKHHGVAKVRVEFLPDETNKLMQKISAKNKIYYDAKPKSKYDIFVENFKNQQTALTTLRKLAKLGKSIIVTSNGNYKVMLLIDNQAQAKNSLIKVKNLGYKNAKIIHH